MWNIQFQWITIKSSYMSLLKWQLVCWSWKMTNQRQALYIYYFMTFIRFSINCKFDLVINHQLDCPKQLIINYNRSMVYHCWSHSQTEMACLMLWHVTMWRPPDLFTQHLSSVSHKTETPTISSAFSTLLITRPYCMT